MNREIWKQVKWYEWLYKVSSKWIILSERRYKILDYVSKRYLKVNLVDSIWNRKQIYVHRIVAEHFIENPENKKEVNHKDWNKRNNNVENLEWVTSSENRKHAYNTWLLKKKFWKENHISKKIIQKDLWWNIINVFDTIKEASISLWLSQWNICSCCRWYRKQTWNFIFSYKT